VPALIQQMIDTPGPSSPDFVVNKSENVYPMVPRARVSPT